MSKEIQIKIKTIDGTDFTLKVKENIPVVELKRVISNLKNIPIERQRIIYQGRVFRNDQDLSFYNVEENDVLHLVTMSEEDLRARQQQRSRGQQRRVHRSTGTPAEEEEGEIIMSSISIPHGSVQSLGDVMNSVFDSFSPGSRVSTHRLRGRSRRSNSNRAQQQQQTRAVPVSQLTTSLGNFMNMYGSNQRHFQRFHDLLRRESQLNRQEREEAKELQKLLAPIIRQITTHSNSLSQYIPNLNFGNRSGEAFTRTNQQTRMTQPRVRAVNVHVHCNPDELEELPRRLQRLEQRVNVRNSNVGRVAVPRIESEHQIHEIRIRGGEALSRRSGASSSSSTSRGTSSSTTGESQEEESRPSEVELPQRRATPRPSPIPQPRVVRPSATTTSSRTSSSSSATTTTQQPPRNDITGILGSVLDNLLGGGGGNNDQPSTSTPAPSTTTTQTTSTHAPTSQPSGTSQQQQQQQRRRQRPQQQGGGPPSGRRRNFGDLMGTVMRGLMNQQGGQAGGGGGGEGGEGEGSGVIGNDQMRQVMSSVSGIIGGTGEGGARRRMPNMQQMNEMLSSFQPFINSVMGGGGGGGSGGGGRGNPMNMTIGEMNRQMGSSYQQSLLEEILNSLMEDLTLVQWMKIMGGEWKEFEGAFPKFREFVIKKLLENDVSETNQKIVVERLITKIEKQLMHNNKEFARLMKERTKPDSKAFEGLMDVLRTYLRLIFHFVVDRPERMEMIEELRNYPHFFEFGKDMIEGYPFSSLLKKLWFNLLGEGALHLYKSCRSGLADVEKLVYVLSKEAIVGIPSMPFTNAMEKMNASLINEVVMRKFREYRERYPDAKIAYTNYEGILQSEEREEWMEGLREEEAWAIKKVVARDCLKEVRGRGLEFSDAYQRSRKRKKNKKEIEEESEGEEEEKKKKDDVFEDSLDLD